MRGPLRKVWAVLDAPAGKRLAPFLGEVVTALERAGELDLVGHEGGDPRGDFAQTLTVTDIFSGWTETQAVKNKAQRWVFAALMQIRAALPFRCWARLGQRQRYLQPARVCV